jgi:mRNA interferase RelE/StbE
MYRILVRGKAAKQIQQISPPHFQRIQAGIDRLADNPRSAGVKKLKGNVGYRLRAGDYRILFEIDDSTQTVIIYRVKHRREVYR